MLPLPLLVVEQVRRTVAASAPESRPGAGGAAAPALLQATGTLGRASGGGGGGLMSPRS